MAEQSELSRSPAWKKPSHVMKVRLRKRRASSVGNAHSLAPGKAALSSTGRSRSSSDQDNGTSRSGKRRNPFGQDGGPPARRRASQNVDKEEDAPMGRMGCRNDDISPQTEELDHCVTSEARNDDCPGGVSLFQALDSGDDKGVFEDDADADEQETQSAEYRLALKAHSSGHAEEETDKETSSEKERMPEDTNRSQFLPLDWTIKSRLRFTSPQSFGWSAPLKTTEEASGLCSFVRCEDVSCQRDRQSESAASTHSRWKARLQRSLMTWSHPHLPWVKLYPRITLRSKATSTSFAASDETIQKELMASWSESFRSVFYLLRSGHCLYFYLLAHQYTVLFRAAGVGGVRHVHALFSPTTKGLREAFKEEGIEFSMPLAKLEDQNIPSKTDLEDQYRQTEVIEGQRSEVTDSREPDHDSMLSTRGDEQGGGDKEEEEEEEEELGLTKDDDAASSWLQSMGLDRQSFPTLEPSKVNFQRDHLMRVDNRPESVVFIQGSDTQALYNFLLNTKTTVATTGATAGIPPTLLAPVAFQGATLGSFKWKPSVMKQAVGNKLLESYSLDVSGPLLSHNIFSICKLLEESQDGAFDANFNNHEPTLPFSQIANRDDNQSGSERREEELSDRSSSSTETLSEFLTASDRGRWTGVLKELRHLEDSYTW